MAHVAVPGIFHTLSSHVAFEPESRSGGGGAGLKWTPSSPAAYRKPQPFGHSTLTYKPPGRRFMSMSWLETDCPSAANAPAVPHDVWTNHHPAIPAAKIADRMESEDEDSLHLSSEEEEEPTDRVLAMVHRKPSTRQAAHLRRTMSAPTAAASWENKLNTQLSNDMEMNQEAWDADFDVAPDGAPNAAHSLAIPAYILARQGQVMNDAENLRAFARGIEGGGPHFNHASIVLTYASYCATSRLEIHLVQQQKAWDIKL
jgi:hypothetical protein